MVVSSELGELVCAESVYVCVSVLVVVPLVPCAILIAIVCAAVCVDTKTMERAISEILTKELGCTFLVRIRTPHFDGTSSSCSQTFSHSLC